MPPKVTKKTTERTPLASGYRAAKPGATAKKRAADDDRANKRMSAPAYDGGKTAKKRAADDDRANKRMSAPAYDGGKTAKKRATDSARKSDVTKAPQKKVIAGGITGAKRRRDDARSVNRTGGTAKAFRTSNRGD